MASVSREKGEVPEQPVLVEAIGIASAENRSWRVITGGVRQELAGPSCPLVSFEPSGAQIRGGLIHAAAAAVRQGNIACRIAGIIVGVAITPVRRRSWTKPMT
ncbi:hypothetical protein CU254_25675 [Amycolatopsis sp. AA4]|nr:hypothetical protein CU254_25675 [Amycolatopsis sp. AA4]EFL09384.1 predicted protein [Streptomyces sp. AA4]